MKIDVMVTVDQTALERLTDAELRKFLERQGQNMVAQVRKNIVASGGKAASGWPPLSKEYAKRKKDGQTPGQGKNRYAMLRDTGSMYDGLAAVVGLGTGNGIGATVELTSTGHGGGDRPSNAELLVIHAEGRGRVPRRDPTEDMTLFERRFEEELEKLLAEKERATG
jgi:hypothetical protein